MWASSHGKKKKKNQLWKAEGKQAEFKASSHS
jgi:hypothetical protein